MTGETKKLGWRLRFEQAGEVTLAAVLIWSAVTLIMGGTLWKGTQVLKSNLQQRQQAAEEAAEGAVGIVPMPKPPEPKKEEEPEPAPKPKVRVVEEEVHRPAPQPQVQAPAQQQPQVIVLNGGSTGEANQGHTNTGTDTDCAQASRPHYNASSDMGMDDGGYEEPPPSQECGSSGS